MTSLKSALVLLVTTLCLTSDGLILDGQYDCGVSDWSAWRKPYIYGMMYRVRHVLDHPPDGDDVCTNRLYEVDLDPDFVFDDNSPTTMLPIDIRANMIIDNFLRRSSKIHNKRAISSRALRDLLLIVDSSRSVGSSNFRKAMIELTALLGTLCPTPDPFNVKYNHAALIDFETSPHEIFDFNAYGDTTKMFDAIRNMAYIIGGTRTDKAFEYAKTMFSAAKGMRADPKIKQEVLVMTDGMPNVPGVSTLRARELHAMADVYGLIIGQFSGAGQKEIRTYVSSQTVNHLFAASTFSELSVLLNVTINKLLTKPGLQCVYFNP